jgi:hypothetical protein
MSQIRMGTLKPKGKWHLRQLTFSRQCDDTARHRMTPLNLTQTHLNTAERVNLYQVSFFF